MAKVLPHRPRLYTIAAAVSLVLCAAAVALWARGYWATDAVAYAWVRGDGDFRHAGVESSRGRLWVGVVGVPRPMAPPALRPGWIRQTRAPHGAVGPAGSWRRLGFGVTSAGGRGLWVRSVTVPLWFVSAVLAAPAAWRLLARPGAVRRERRAKGLCVRCGYDLRASVGRCPECAEPIRGAV